MAHARTFATMFSTQLVLYSLLCVNYRAVAHAQYIPSAVTDFAIASLQFFVIRKIATSSDSLVGWAGFALGGVAGSFLGIWLSLEVLGK